MLLTLGGHHWVSGENLTYDSGWDGLPPAESDPGCVVMTKSSTHSAYWKNVDCTSNHRYICQIPNGKARTPPNANIFVYFTEPCLDLTVYQILFVI